MAIDWAEFRADIASVVQEFNENEATLTKVTLSEDPSDALNTNETPVDHPCIAIVWDGQEAPAGMVGADFVFDGVEQGKRLGFVSAEGLSVVPALTDRLTVNGTTYEITDIPFQGDPGGVDVGWIVEVQE